MGKNGIIIIMMRFLLLLKNYDTNSEFRESQHLFQFPSTHTSFMWRVKRQIVKKSYVFTRIHYRTSNLYYLPCIKGFVRLWGKFKWGFEWSLKLRWRLRLKENCFYVLCPLKIIPELAREGWGGRCLNLSYVFLIWVFLSWFPHFSSEYRRCVIPGFVLYTYNVIPYHTM